MGPSSKHLQKPHYLIFLDPITPIEASVGSLNNGYNVVKMQAKLFIIHDGLVNETRL